MDPYYQRRTWEPSPAAQSKRRKLVQSISGLSSTNVIPAPKMSLKESQVSVFAASEEADEPFALDSGSDSFVPESSSQPEALEEAEHESSESSVHSADEVPSSLDADDLSDVVDSANDVDIDVPKTKVGLVALEAAGKLVATLKEVEGADVLDSDRVQSKCLKQLVQDLVDDMCGAYEELAAQHYKREDAKQ